jgi:glycosyltransferase involved in cell wall biosynthesis
MIKGRFFSLIIFSALFIYGTNVMASTPPSINLISADRSGLAKDRKILQKALEDLGCHVNWYNNDNPIHATQADINIFCEKLIPECFEKAEFNWFIPNPEWIWHGLELLNSVDLILCRTYEVERIFKDRKKKTFYLGFTSPDHRNKKIQKDYKSFLHLAGTSWQKGTLPILKAWNNHPEFPRLTAIRFADPQFPPPKNVTYITDWLPEDQLHLLQNTCGIHICLSETEGFGHSLMESMSVGAVVITTCAPPMYEFIEDKRCLVPFHTWGTQHLATTYFVRTKEVEKKIQALLKLPESELQAIGKKNREKYLQYRRHFHANLANLIKNWTQK